MSDAPANDPSTNDPWARLRLATRARIGLGRAGDALPTGALLDFQLAHARARDAVHTPFDTDALAAQFGNVPVVRVVSAAPSRAVYLQRPDLGRRLSPESAAALPPGLFDVAFVIGDGLSATAVHAHAVPTLKAILTRLDGWSVAPVVLATGCRVALGDDIGARLGAGMVAVLIGERPGLSTADSLGIYLTYEPKPGRRDSERNCISNIHPPDGLGYEAAADKLAWLMREARRLKLTGVSLKDDAPALDARP
ncbi:ethanolamine ammonia-lyase subunit EutC [Azospirillum soli]|uniref:ethanolamine ammonia-lyase subunit EutC n=1 Tax=Azospirillum soli TaxID=1304799 RepID=UPI001AE238F8|nr:ethanolamine ammonia-lyase subunit EutC [Azospirillum soli]MBP2313817.1 ethanolamine ammonia-lyase small subunit [Azospirillum soli]